MVTVKRKSDKPGGTPPSSAPELSAEQKSKIEAALSVDNADNMPVAEQDITSKEEPAQKFEAGDGTSEDVATSNAGQPSRLRRFFAGYWHRKLWTIPLTLLVIVGLLAGVPASRYALAAYVVSQPVSVTVLDATTKKPVTSADVKLDDQTYKTDKTGKIQAPEVKPGKHIVTVAKKYYKNETLTVDVPITKGVDSSVSLIATGRQVPVSVINKISGKPLADVTLASVGTEVKTDKDGKAVIVLPADRVDLPVKLSNGGYNTLEARIKVTDQTVKDNSFSMVPGGKVYFLSRQSGKIDVVKTDLDGGNRQTVVAGTGKEEDRNTVLLASRDWKYMALLSRRDSGVARLYLIDAASDKMSEIDSGTATFSLVGWEDHDFAYSVDRTNINYGEANKVALKSFNADKKQIFTIDQTASQADGDTKYYQSFSNPTLIGGKLAYTVSWSYSGYTYNPNFTGRDISLRLAPLSTSGKKDIKTWPSDQYYGIDSVLYAPDELYIALYSSGEGKQSYYEYENGVVKDADEGTDREKFNTSYPTYLKSPDGKRAFWSEERDGRPTFFLGDASGANGKQLTVVEDGQVYGWYGDGYLLLSKKGSELYIMPVDGGTPLKIADYHKPQLSYRGYGGGYGGL